VGTVVKKNDNIIVFGATGMFGSELYTEALSRGYDVIGVSRHGPDISVDVRNENDVRDVIIREQPDIIINSAAIVSHALCEDDPKLAHDVNTGAVAVMAAAAGEVGSRLIQISTDHFFSGDGRELHNEEAPIKLLNEYARTKYEGENFALTCPNALVIRTNITGFRDGGGIVSFMEWVVASLESHEKFNLFSDYYTSTISTRQATTALFDLLEHDVQGRINLACREAASKQEFVEAVAKRIDRSADQARVISVHGVLTARAESVGLDVSRAEKLLGYRLPDLNDVVDQLVSEYQARKDKISELSRSHVGSI